MTISLPGTLTVLLLLFRSTATAQFGPVPAVLGTSYVTVDPLGMKIKIGFQEQPGKLTVYEEWSNGKKATIDIRYQDLVAVSSIEPLPGGKWSVMVQQRTTGMYFIPFNSKDDAVAVARYLSDLSGTGRGTTAQTQPAVTAALEPPKNYIACPPGADYSCKFFYDLIEHNDSEIIGYLHRKDPKDHVHACFSEQGSRFFIMEYRSSSVPSIHGTFLLSEFEDGVQQGTQIASITWNSDNFGYVTPAIKGEEQTGTITESGLEYSHAFTNLGGTKTNYALAVRWSTGKYVERYTWPNKKGEVQLSNYTGFCVTLN